RSASTLTQLPFRSNRTGPEVSSVVSDPSRLTQVVDVSVRSDSASTRLPERFASARAEGTSGADDCLSNPSRADAATVTGRGAGNAAPLSRTNGRASRAVVRIARLNA